MTDDRRTDPVPLHTLISRARRTALKGATALAASQVLPAWSQSTSEGPIRVIVGLPPGGAADIIARVIAQAHEKAIGRPVIVENRPGGQFQISMQALASAPADGRTLLYLYNGYASVSAVQRLFDLERQTVPITQVASTPIVLLARADLPFKTLSEVVAHGKANPGKLTYATLGPGGVEHLKLEQMLQLAGVRATAVPYKGGPDMLKALLGGEVDLSLNAGLFAKQYGPTGQVRVLAVLEPSRWVDLPEIPTLAQAGLNVPPLAYWGGYAVRAGTPDAIVQRLFGELTAAAATPLVQEKLAANGGTLLLSKSPDEFRRVIATDIAWMTEAAKGLQLT